MGRDPLPVLAIGAFFVLLIMGITLWQIRLRGSRLARSEQEKNEELAHRELCEEGVRRGDLLRDPLTGMYYPRCVICSGRATAYAPVTRHSWLDRISVLTRLFSLPPRYVIADDHAGELQYCRPHKELAVRQLEHFHARVRAERSEFNSQQEDMVARMETGGLIEMVQAAQAPRLVVGSATDTPLPALSAAPDLGDLDLDEAEP